MRLGADGAECGGLERGSGEGVFDAASGRVRRFGVRALTVAARVATAEILEEERGVAAGGYIRGSLRHQGLEAVASARMT